MTITVPQSIDEATHLVEILENEPDDVFIENQSVLLRIIDSTNHYGLRDFLVMRLAKLSIPDFFPLLIKHIKLCFDIPFRAGLIYGCSFYDCSSHASLFADLLMLKTDVSSWGAHDVLLKMTKIDEDERSFLVRKLRLFCQYFCEDGRNRDIEEVIKHLKNLGN